MASKKRTSASSSSRKRSRASEDASQSKNALDKRKTSKELVSKGANNQLKYGVIVLIVAILIGVVWNKFDSTDPRVQNFLSKACQKTAYCSRFVIPTRRTLQAGRQIRTGETLVEIPRSLQMWDLDAYLIDCIIYRMKETANGTFFASSFLSFSSRST